MKEIQISAPIVGKKYRAIFLLVAFIIYSSIALEGKAINGSIIVIDLIEIYQVYVSDKVPFKCRYEVTCSEYAKQAIKKHGLKKGIVLSFKRIHSCM